MKEKAAIARRSDCPISIALEMLGDTWSLLIVRDMIFSGLKTYNDFLNSGEGIATNILSDRLQRLEGAGIITKLSDTNDARRYIYRLTEHGIDLAPMLTEMILWSAQYEETAASPAVIRAMKKDRAAFLAQVRKDWKASV